MDQHLSRKSRRPIPRRYLILALAVMILSMMLVPPPTKSGPSSQANKNKEPAITTPEQLTQRLRDKLGEQSGVSIKNLGTGEEFRLTDDRSYDAASVMKLVIVGFMYNAASNDQFDLDEVLTIPSRNVQRYGTGTIQYQRPPYKFSYRELARLMMEKSDNTAAFVLAEKLDKKKLQDFADAQGMTHTSITKNTTTPADIVRFLDKLYRNELADPTLSQDMLEILDDSDFEDRLPAKLPDDATVYHKTGDAFGGGLHDAGIVRHGDRAYAIAIFTEGLGPKEQAVRKIAEASRDVFSYQTRRR